MNQKRFKQLIILTLCFLFVGCNESDKISEKSESVQVHDSLSSPKDTLNVAFLIVNGVYNTEFTAAYDIFHHTIFRDGIKPMKVFSITPKDSIIKTFEGISILPDYSFVDNHPQIDVLAVPSAEHHLDTDLENETLINWVKETATQCKFTISFCDGAFVLAKAGILNDLNCTTFPSDIDKLQEMFPEVKTHKNVLWVHDGNIITSSGGAKSFEPALYLCEMLYGKKAAEEIADGMVIDWNVSDYNFIGPSRPFSPKNSAE